MDQTNHDAPVEAEKAKIENERAQLAAIQLQIVELAKPLMAEWFKKTIEGEVRRKPDVTKALPPERLKKLKDDMTKLIADTPRILAEGMKNPAIWPLQAEWPENLIQDPHTSASFPASQFIQDSMRLIEPALKRVAGHAGRLLIDAGYVTRKDEEWEEQQRLFQSMLTAIISKSLEPVTWR